MKWDCAGYAYEKRGEMEEGEKEIVICGIKIGSILMDYDVDISKLETILSEDKKVDKNFALTIG